MPVVLLGVFIPRPVRFFCVGKDDAGVFVDLVGIAPHVVGALGAALGSPARALEPRMLVAGVVDDQLDHYLHVAGMRLVEKLFEVLDRPVGRVDAGVVGDVVAVVPER